MSSKPFNEEFVIEAGRQSTSRAFPGEKFANPLGASPNRQTAEASTAK